VFSQPPYRQLALEGKTEPASLKSMKLLVRGLLSRDAAGMCASCFQWQGHKSGAGVNTLTSSEFRFVCAVAAVYSCT